MGIDASAHLGYGFQITNKKLQEKIQEEEVDLEADGNIVLSFGGDSYADNDSIFAFITDSAHGVYTFDKGGAEAIKADALVVKKDWDAKLNALAKKHNIKNPKIGWWLLTSMS